MLQLQIIQYDRTEIGHPSNVNTITPYRNVYIRTIVKFQKVS